MAEMPEASAATLTTMLNEPSVDGSSGLPSAEALDERREDDRLERDVDPEDGGYAVGDQGEGQYPGFAQITTRGQQRDDARRQTSCVGGHLGAGWRSG